MHSQFEICAAQSNYWDLNCSTHLLCTPFLWDLMPYYFQLIYQSQESHCSVSIFHPISKIDNGSFLISKKDHLFEIENVICNLQIAYPEAVSRRVKGGARDPPVLPTPLILCHPPDWSSGGCRGPPCDIWHFWQRFLYNLHKLHLLKIKFPKILISLFKLKMTINTLKNLWH